MRMKNHFFKSISLILLTSAFMILAACSMPGDATGVYSTPDPLINYVTVDTNDVIAWDYESFSDAASLGGKKFTAHDGEHYGYRGVLTLSDQAVKNYNLVPDDEQTIYGEFDKVNPGAYSSKWYYCKDTYLVFNTIEDWNLDTLLFDGNNKIVFWITESDRKGYN